jgi:predicted Rdx family selenoprotein
MQVTITYCPPCRLRLPAERIAEALQRELNLAAEITPGFWGVFRVECDGEVLFDRWKHRGWRGRLGLGAVPTPEEIVPLVRERLEARVSGNHVAVS